MMAILLGTCMLWTNKSIKNYLPLRFALGCRLFGRY